MTEEDKQEYTIEEGAEILSKTFGITTEEAEAVIAKQLLDNKRKDAPIELTALDVEAIQNASAKLAERTGISLSIAMDKVMLHGIQHGHIHWKAKKPRLTAIEEKPCLHCGKPKRHNNSFCSSDCNRAYLQS